MLKNENPTRRPWVKKHFGIRSTSLLIMIGIAVVASSVLFGKEWNWRELIYGLGLTVIVVAVVRVLFLLTLAVQRPSGETVLVGTHHVVRDLKTPDTAGGKPMNKKMTKGYRNAGKDVVLEGYVKGKRFVPHGEVSITSGKGQRVLLGQYLNGKPNGKWLRWYEDGSTSSEHQYVFGQLVGTSKQYWANGALAREDNYKKGFHDYEFRTYDKQGKQNNYQVYAGGKLVKATTNKKGREVRFDASVEMLMFAWAILPEKICYLDQESKIRCKTPYQMWLDLSTFLEPEIVENIMKQFNDAYSKYGLDSQKGVLTACAGTFVATNVDNSSATVVAADDHNASVTQNELDAITNSCVSSARGALADSGIDSFTNNGQGTQDAVAAMDEAVSNCSEDRNSTIAPMDPIDAVIEGVSGIVGSGISATGDLLGALIDKGYAAVVFNEGYGPEVYEGDGVYRSHQVGPDGKRTKTRNENTGVTQYDVPGSSQHGNVGGRTVTSELSDGSRVIEEYADADKQVLIRTVYKDSDGHVTSIVVPPSPPPPPPPPPAKTDDDEELPDGDADELPDGDADLPGTPVDQTGMSECERLAAWWEMKKLMCEHSNWQAYGCQEIIRIFTGCVDPALVYPTPDGGVGCPHMGGMTREDYRRLECQRRSGIMLPSGFGDQLCRSRDGNFELPETDICSDPSAICLPDYDVPDENRNSQFRFVNRRREGRIARQIKGSIQSTNVIPSFDSYRTIGEINEDNYQGKIDTKDDKVHFVVFASSSCGPCHKVMSVFDDESQKYQQATFNRVDVAQNPDLSFQFGIKYTPTIMVFKNGKPVGQRRVGAASREVLVEYINRSFNLE